MAVIVPKLDIKRSLEEAAAVYHKALLADDEALRYLTQERGISNEALEYFRLGVVRDPLPGHEPYQDRLAFPYITPSGVVDLRFRTLSGSGAKFLGISGMGVRPYNVLALRKTAHVWVTEGETDTIALWQAGIPAIGFPGAESWTRDLAPVFRRLFQGRIVTVVADGDDEYQTPEGKIRRPGKEFAEDIYRYLGGCDIVLLQDTDASQYLKDQGAEALRKKVGFVV